MDDVAALVPQEGAAPEEAVRILSELARREHVRGCMALLASDAQVIWHGGPVFASEDYMEKVVAMVADVLATMRRHLPILEKDAALGLMRLRTSAWELLLTPSTWDF